MIYPIPNAPIPNTVYAGCDFGGECFDVEVIYDPSTNTIEVLGELSHPVFPRALPIELKGIAV
jgi:hypothetical protein